MLRKVGEKRLSSFDIDTKKESRIPGRCSFGWRFISTFSVSYLKGKRRIVRIVSYGVKPHSTRPLVGQFEQAEAAEPRHH